MLIDHLLLHFGGAFAQAGVGAEQKHNPHHRNEKQASNDCQTQFQRGNIEMNLGKVHKE